MSRPDIEGWYVDAMEQNIGMLVAMQRQKDIPLDRLVDTFMDPSTHTDVLTHEQHLMTMAVCMAIMIRRLAQVDV